MTSFDLSEHIAPKSDQLDAVDLLGGDRTFTIERISRNNDEQPFNFHLVGFPRPWRPGLSMRRVLMACWGKDAATYVGRRVTLYCDPDVEFGGAAVGGTRIRALSHIDKPKQVPLLIKRGRSAIFTVKPLAETEPDEVAVTSKTLAELAAMFERKGIPQTARLAGVERIIGGNVLTLDAITEAEGRKVLAALKGRPDVPAGGSGKADSPPVEEPPDDFQGELYEATS